AAVYPREKRIEELFMEQAARTPDAVAVSDGAQDISYRRLDQWSSSLAGQLLKKGICAGDIVAILQRRSADWLINMLAVLKAGACYLPVDPGQPSGRIAYIISSSGCKLVLTGREGYSSVEETPWMHWEKEGTGEEIFPGVENTDSTAPAYVIYTSGTTGMPKGVMVSHRALVNYITWAAALYCQGRPADFPLFTSVSFDLAITSIFVPVVTGNRVIIYDDANHASLLERVIKDNRSDIVKLTPSHLRLLREQRLLDRDVPCKIHTFIVGGEQLDTVLARDIHHLSAGRIRIFNEYGPTEATVGCMIHQFDTAEDYTNVLIGKPVNNTQIYLLDKYLHPVPAGIPGEIYIGGDGLAEGYLNASELTDSRFLDNPLIPGRKMYKTGDSGVRVERGLIECRGRLDRQVKIEGHRVELAEIDYHLMCYQHMQQVVVETVKDKGGRNSLAAYYTLDPGVEEIPDVEDLIRYMAERVPYYMIPGHFIRMNSFPLTANGKVDLKALPRPDADSGGRGKEPSGDRERKLAVVWEEVLGAENVGPDSNFFQLGGDSIKAFRITARLKQHSMLLEASDILIYQTVGRLAPRIRYMAAEPEIQPVIAGKRALLPMEAWFFEQAFKHPGFYNQSVLLQLQEHTDLTLAEKAMQLLVSRHDGLRLNYDPVSKQLFYNPKHLQGIITFTDCSGYTPEMLEIFKGDFDIADDLLIKAGVIRDKTGIVQLLITAHHLLVDGVSWRTLLTDLQQLYQHLAGKTAVPEYNAVLPAAQWLKHLQAYGDVWAGKEKAYWDRAASCLFRIPGKTQGADWRYVNRKTCSGTLSREETDFLLKEANVPYKTEPVMLLLVALGQLLREWAETDELLIMMEGHGRQLGDISIAATVGWFTSMYPFRFDVGGASIGEQIKNVKEQYRMIPAHGIGFGIDRYIKPDAEKANMEKIPVLFNYLGQLDEGSDNPLFSTLHIPPGRETHAENEMYCQLEYNLMIIDGVLTIALSFNETIHEPQLIERLVEQYQEKLKMLLQYLLESKDVHFSHSDFRLANLDEQDLKILFG
ncbi:amino acid adenylation domain-containing protein, partial [Chitinophaga sp.]|uniref:amino acid adenylation domain-containing protein n=1 Tax=Chitinophaga sp. TaxID=1869181 RepID=UPI002C5BB8A6